MTFSLKKLLPKSLLKRSVLIIIVPMLLVQLISAYVFLDRHLDTITRNIATNLANSIDLIAVLYRQKNPALRLTIQRLGFDVKHHPERKFYDVEKSSFSAWEDKVFHRALKNTLHHPYKLFSSEDLLTVYVQIEKDLVSFKFSRKRLMSRTTPLVFFWSRRAGSGGKVGFMGFQLTAALRGKPSGKPGENTKTQ